MNNNFIFLKFFLLSTGIHLMILSIFSFYESSKELAEANVIYFDLVNHQDSSLKKNEKIHHKEKVIKKIYEKEHIPKDAEKNSENSQSVNTKIRTELKVANENQLIDNAEKIELKDSYNSSKQKTVPQNYYSEKNKIINQEDYKKKYGAFYKIGTLNNPHPKYPLIARKKGWQGRIILQVSVNNKGIVDNIEILKSSGYEILDSESTNTIKEWKFKPAMIGKTPVNDVLAIPIRFMLDN
tara:strand:+ start:95 stop:811 length:717 start_codon:yes stop_codon:yes gene_type:complete